MRTIEKKSILFVLAALMVMMIAAFPASAAVKKHTHKYGSWKVTNAATCKSTGTKKRYCTVKGCSVSQSQTIPVNKNAHKWVNATSSSAPYKAATCTSDGFGYKQRCKLCNTPTNRYTITKLGHSYNKKGICTRCHKKKK